MPAWLPAPRRCGWATKPRDASGARRERCRSPPPWPSLFGYAQFPVCSSALARDAARPLKTPADLSRHVLLDFETARYGRSWYDWARCFGAKGLRNVRAAGSLRFSHYDQVIEAAVNGSGVAVGKWPHLIGPLREGTLVAPMGAEGVARLGGFHLLAHRAA